MYAKYIPMYVNYYNVWQIMLNVCQLQWCMVNTSKCMLIIAMYGNCGLMYVNYKNACKYGLMCVNYSNVWQIWGDVC